MVSPDRRMTVEFRCRPDESMLMVVNRPAGSVELQLQSDRDEFWRPQEVLWAPDSTRLIVNGSASAYASFDFLLIDLSGARVIRRDITADAHRDMFERFPPCRASGMELNECMREPGYANMSAIAWTRGSSALLVFAEVPCSSSFGGIMCQVMGYEVHASNGLILDKITARQMKTRWQKHMAWPMRVPEAPQYRN